MPRSAPVELTLGELIRRTRRNRDINQELAGRELKVNQSTVAKWERGDRPAPEKLPLIARFIDMPLPQVLQLYHGTRDMGYAATVAEINARLADLHTLVSTLAPLVQRVEALERHVSELTGGSVQPTRVARRTRRSADTPPRSRSTSPR